MKPMCRQCGRFLEVDRYDQYVPCACSSRVSRKRARRDPGPEFTPCDTWDQGDDPDWQYGDRLQFGFDFFMNGEGE